MSLPDDVMAKVVNEWLDVLADIEKANDRKTELAEIIIEHLPVGQRYELMPGVGVRVQAPAPRFSPARAAEILTAEQLAAISMTLPNVTGLKFIPAVLADMCRVATGPPSVRRL